VVVEDVVAGAGATDLDCSLVVVVVLVTVSGLPQPAISRALASNAVQAGNRRARVVLVMA
jgi:hypothetical protein